MNVLHWHISDSQSFPSESKVFPQLSQQGAYSPAAVYSVSDMQDLVRYALQRGVRIVPEWDLPGHGRWRGVPGLSMGCKGTNGGLFGAVLDPTQKSTYEFLTAFLSEMGEIFTDPYLFLGGDEVDPTCWDQNPNVSAWLKEHGMNSTELEQYFWEQVS